MRSVIELPKHRQLYRELRHRLLAMEPGSSFYSVRELMRDFEVSQATVSKAISALCDEHLLDKNVGSGTFVTEEVLKYRDNAPPVICLALPRWVSSWHFGVEHAFYQAAETLNFTPEVVLFDWQETIIRRLPDKKIDALLMVPSSAAISIEEISALNGYGIPYVMFGRSLKGLNVDCTFEDEEFSGTLAADHLIKLGHRKLAVAVTEPLISNIQERVNGFVRYAELQGAEVAILDCAVRAGDIAQENSYRFFKRLLAAGKPDFTGLFAVSSNPVMAIFKAMHEAGIKIPEQVSVIGLGDGHVDYEYYYPALTVIQSNIKAMVVSGTEILLKRLREPECGTMKHSEHAELVVRESTACGPFHESMSADNRSK